MAAMKKKFKEIIKKALVSGATPLSLTRSFCTGIYIAFSPFPGLHSVMMFGFKYLMNLHFPTLFVATSINNPWTMIPFYTLDYAFGYWIVHTLFGWTPSWGISLAKLFGSGTICVWSFLIGGNLLGIVAALISYPIMSKIFTHLAATAHDKQNASNDKQLPL